MMRGIAPFEWKGSGTTGAPARRRLLDRNRIGRRKGVLEGLVERLFLAPALIAIAIVLMRFAFRIGNHFGFSDGADKDLAMTQIWPETLSKRRSSRALLVGSFVAPCVKVAVSRCQGVKANRASVPLAALCTAATRTVFCARKDPPTAKQRHAPRSGFTPEAAVRR